MGFIENVKGLFRSEQPESVPEQPESVPEQSVVEASFQRHKVEDTMTQPIGEDERRVLSFLGLDADHMPRDEMAQATFYTCQKTLSETVGKLPLKRYQRTENGVIVPPMSQTHRLLSRRPNDYMTACTYWSLQEKCCNMFGNAYSYIDRRYTKYQYGGKYEVAGIYPLFPGNVTMLVDDAGVLGTHNCIYYYYVNPYTGEASIFYNHEMLHFKTWDTTDGLLGIPVKDRLRAMIDGMNASSEFESNLYKNGLTAKMVMTFSSNLDDKRIAEIQKKFADRLTGPQAAGKVIPIPEGLELKALNNSLADSQFEELRRYSSRQIAAAFGVQLYSLNDFQDLHYSTFEASQLAFLDSLSYRLKMYEEELNSKLLTPKEEEEGYYYKFNEKALLRMDSKTQSEVLSNYVDHGVYTHNEARDFLDMPHKEGGDELLVNGSYVPVAQAGIAYDKNNGGNSNEND